MLENILLAIVLPLLNSGVYFLAIVLPLMNAGEIGYYQAISKCCRIICWPFSCHSLMQENILLAIVFPLINLEIILLAIVLV